MGLGTIGLVHNGTGLQWAWYTMGLDTIGLIHNETVHKWPDTQWD